MTDTVNIDRLEKDVSAVKGDISALTRQISDVMNSLAGTARKEARRGYKQARAAAEDTIGDLSERGSAMMDAAQDAERVASLRELACSRGLDYFEISSATGQGIEALKQAMGERVLQPAEAL